MWVFFWVALALVVGVFASNKGRSGLGWFLLSLVISPLLGFLFVAVSANLKAGDASGGGAQPGPATHVKCAACAEWVLPQATVCKHCGAALQPDVGFEARKAQAASDARADNVRDYMYGVAAVAVVVLLLLMVSNCSG